MANQIASRARHQPFFGWYVVGAAFVVFFLGFGFIYSFSVFAKPIADSIHYDVEGVTALFSLCYTVYLITGVLAGFLADRVGARAVVALGGILMGLGLLAASQSTTNLQISAAFGLGIGPGLGCFYVPASNVVEAWFIRRRGYATGITVLGFSTGNLVVGPVLAEAILRFGVRAALGGFGVIVLVAVPALALLMISRPEDRGLYPDGDVQPPPTLAEEEGGLTLRQAIRTRAFWHLYMAIFLASFAIYLPFAHLGTFAVKYGASPVLASMVVGLLGLGGIIGRLALGGYTDRVKPIVSLFIAFVGLALAMAIWYRSLNIWGLAVFAVVFGIFYTTSSAVEPAAIVNYFGERHGGAIMGMMFTSAAAGSLLGPTITAEVVDRTGSYGLAIVAGAALFVLAAASLPALPKPPIERIPQSDDRSGASPQQR